ncbi:hypothetical protein HDU89_000965 [Geranomyces variabilis]|nr:hypothetical protein HDU89_000965 [Geranomyces variabilis]
MDFQNYKDFNKKQKLNDRNYDIIIADEWDTTAATFSRDCKTHLAKDTNLAANWAIWLSQLTKAKKVIIMDAFSTRLTYNFLEHFRQHNYKDHLDSKTQQLGAAPLNTTKCKAHSNKVYEFVNLQKKPNPRQFIESETFKDWTWHIFKALEAGKKIYIFTPFKKDENRAYIRDLETNVKCCFDWDRIPSIPSDAPEEKFVEDADEDMIKDIWEKNADFPRKMEVLRDNPDHLINVLLKENNVTLDENFHEFPDQMQTTIPITDIQRVCHFHNPPKDYRTSLCSKMLESFFQRKVYFCKPQPQKRKAVDILSDEEPEKAAQKGTGKRKRWVYETDGDFAEMVEYGVPLLTTVSKVDILADDEED